MDSSPGCNIDSDSHIRVTNIWHFSSAINSQKAQTTVTLANTRYSTSVQGVERNLYSFYRSMINLVFDLLFRSVSFPHIEFRHNLARPRLAELGRIASLSNRMPSLLLVANITLPIFLSLQSVRVSAGLSLEFQEVVDVFCKKPTIACQRIIFCDLIFLHFAHLDKFVFFMHGLPNFIQHPGSY